MMTLILATLLTATPKPATTAQFRPCVWPNTCKQAAGPATATEMAPLVAQFTTCVWPHRCSKKRAPRLIAL